MIGYLILTLVIELPSESTVLCTTASTVIFFSDANVTNRFEILSGHHWWLPRHPCSG